LGFPQSRKGAKNNPFGATGPIQPSDRRFAPKVEFLCGFAALRET
jgi:hypothetical protein